MDTSATADIAPAPAGSPPSDWIVRWTPLLPPAARVLDVACGHGRHVRWLAAAGHRMTAVDREPGDPERVAEHDVRGFSSHAW